MKANTMLKRLGYKLIVDKNNILIYEKPNKDRDERCHILFNSNKNEFIAFKGWLDYYSKISYIDCKTLKAISKKCEELKWK